MGPSKMIDVDHWSDHYNCHPSLDKMDVEVKICQVPDPSRAKWSPKDQVLAAHILYSTKNEVTVNYTFGNMHNKVQKAFRATGDIPEGHQHRYVHFKATHKITQTLLCKQKLQKIWMMQQFTLDWHHSIPFWGLGNIYQILTAPNGTEFSICQVIMSIKSAQDFISPLLIAVDQFPKGKVVIICNQSMKEEAEAFLSHFALPSGGIWSRCVTGFL